MSIIEQAARRLEELRRSGIELPGSAWQKAGGSGTDAHAKGADRSTAQTPGPARESHDGVVREIGPSSRAASPPRVSKRVQIDLAALAAAGYLTPDTPRARIADEFRVIKRPLLTNVQGRSAAAPERANLIMVTSSLPGEGKTFISLNLAISLAMELDTTVLLVDADVSRPSVLRRLGLPASPGLLDLLTSSSLGVADTILRTNIDKLSILPAGSPQGRATELLASEGMSRLLDDLAKRYADRILVFDAPPLLPSTESRVLATRMGQVVLVIEAEHTPIKTVTQALAAIEACPVVLPLLNKISRSEVGSYYGYYAPVEG